MVRKALEKSLFPTWCHSCSRALPRRGHAVSRSCCAVSYRENSARHYIVYLLFCSSVQILRGSFHSLYSALQNAHNAQQISVYLRCNLHFTPVYHNAMQLCISIGVEEVVRKPGRFAKIAHGCVFNSGGLAKGILAKFCILNNNLYNKRLFYAIPTDLSVWCFGNESSLAWG